MKLYRLLRLLAGGLMLTGGLLMNVTYADTITRNAALKRIEVVLNQLQPMMTLAEQNQDKQAPLQVNFHALRGDIHKIQTGIEAILHPVAIMPRTVPPLSGDYIYHTTEIHHDASTTN